MHLSTCLYEYLFSFSMYIVYSFSMYIVYTDFTCTIQLSQWYMEVCLYRFQVSKCDVLQVSKALRTHTCACNYILCQDPPRESLAGTDSVEAV